MRPLNWLGRVRDLREQLRLARRSAIREHLEPYLMQGTRPLRTDYLVVIWSSGTHCLVYAAKFSNTTIGLKHCSIV
jgi:hypothetical protein